MPTQERVAQFVAMIEGQQFLESIPLFYAEDMTAQENGEPPRCGRAAQLDHEKAALARSRFVGSRAVSVVVDGDRSSIHWEFDIEVGPGLQVRLEEVACQTWRGDRIATERYFYDPGQLTRVRPAT